MSARHDPAAVAPEGQASLLRQPTAVWAVAFACVVAFMGIGLVDPILPAISAQLGASPSQTMLLFTSYLAVTGLTMFVTSWVAGRIGARRTLLLGLALVVVFAGLAGLSGSVGQIIGLRAGWGLGNALFISTALATIVGAASGGVDGAIVLYEAALGLGIATGPLLGGALGAISWRGPFLGTAVLMAVALAAIAVLLPRRGPAPQPVPITATLAAFRHPALLTLALAALFYNVGFFSLLAYTPFPLEAAAGAAGMADFGAHELGLVFCAWGLALAVTSVFAAPALTRRLGRLPVLVGGLGLLALDLAVMALGVHRFWLLVGATVAAGLVLGVLNTVLTESVMEATELPRSVASSTYSGIRFLGGALAPAVAGPLATVDASAPYLLGASAVVVAVAVLLIRRRRLAGLATPEPPLVSGAEATVLTAAGA